MSAGKHKTSHFLLAQGNENIKNKAVILPLGWIFPAKYPYFSKTRETTRGVHIQSFHTTDACVRHIRIQHIVLKVRNSKLGWNRASVINKCIRICIRAFLQPRVNSVPTITYLYLNVDSLR